MTQVQSEKIAGELHAKLVAHFGPRGIEVTYVLTDWRTYGPVANYAFRRANQNESLPGVYSEMAIHLDLPKALRCQSDATELDRVVAAWEQLLADWVPNLFGRAPAANA